MSLITAVIIVCLCNQIMLSSTSMIYYSYVGCYKDESSRALGDYQVTGDNGMTVEKCVDICAGKMGNNTVYYAGPQYSRECYCGTAYNKYGKESDSDCNEKCAGNISETCGGSWRFSAYEMKKTTLSTSSHSYSYVGCYKDASSRALTDYQVTNDNGMTVEKCVDICVGKMSNNTVYYAGPESANQCYCGTDYNKYGGKSESDCNKACGGDSNEMCGGSWRFSAYQIITSDYYITYVGCYKDESSRALSDYQVTGDNGMTVEKCVDICVGKMGDKSVYYAGPQYSSQCYCGTDYDKYGQESESDCNKACAGDSDETCGGTWRFSAYKITISKYDITYVGCYKDESSRALGDYKVTGDNGMTVENCVDICLRKMGNNTVYYAGPEYSRECYCGTDYDKYGKESESDCNKKCAGDSDETCGGTWRFSAYKISIK